VAELSRTAFGDVLFGDDGDDFIRTPAALDDLGHGGIAALSPAATNKTVQAAIAA